MGSARRTSAPVYLGSARVDQQKGRGTYAEGLKLVASAQRLQNLLLDLLGPSPRVPLLEVASGGQHLHGELLCLGLGLIPLRVVNPQAANLFVQEV